MITVGTKFKISAQGKTYKGKIFTCTEVEENINPAFYSYKCTDQNNDVFFFSQVNLDYYGDSVKILSQSKYDHKLLQTATAQVTARAISFNDEHNGSMLWTAIEKAIKELKENGSIKFENGVLSFISRFSNQSRFVTKDGCSELCPCKNQISYHKSIFDILTRYFELQTETKVKRFPVRETAQVRRAA